MVFWFVYALLLFFALWFFAACAITYWWTGRKRKSRTRQMRTSGSAIEKQIAALEAQFIVAPGIALRETRALCATRDGGRSEERRRLRTFLEDLERRETQRVRRAGL